MKNGMKKILLVLLFLKLSTISLIGRAQIQKDPGTWAYGLKKIKGDTYEIHLRCTLDEGWHIYAQKQTMDFIGTKTRIMFDKQLGLVLIGTPEERGKRITYENKEVGVTNYEYSGVVDFVQKAVIKSVTKKISGTVTYQTCTHKQCLSEKTISFSIPIK